MDNRQAIGYMFLACKRAGLNKEQTKEIFGHMYVEFDLKTEEEAEELGYKWYYALEEE